MKITFYGARLGDNELNGMIMSGEIIENFDANKWIPDYQRERLERKTKIEGIKKVYQGRKKIDEVLLHLKGKVNSGREPGKYILDGDIVIIDGQQRISSLAETDIVDYAHPARILVNLSREEEIELFQRLNGTGTVLTMGDYIASYSGPMAKLVQKLMKNRRSNAIPLSRNSNKAGLSAAMGVMVLYWAYNQIKGKATGTVIPKNTTLKNFLQDTNISVKDMQMAEYALKKLSELFTSIFGNYEYKAQAYQRPFFLGFSLLIIRNFMDGTGHIDIKRFKSKIEAIPKSVFGTSRFKETQAGGLGNEVIAQMHDLMVKHLNFKLKGDLLPKFAELEEAQEHAYKILMEEERDAKRRLRTQEAQSQMAVI